MSSVNNKVAFVPGGAGGIGLAIVKKLLENGAKGVAIVDISADSGNKAINELSKTFDENKVIFIKTDITITKELEAAFETTVKTFKQLDIVINSAGITNEIEWEKTLAINLTAVIQATYLALQKYLPKYKSGEEGVIVNIASVLGFQATQVSPVYCATKHGLVGFGRSLGGEEFYKKYQVRVLTVCPGLVRSPMSDRNTVVQKILFPEKMLDEARILKFKLQEAENVGVALIEVIKNGKTGSVWVTEYDQPPYEVSVPEPQSMKLVKT